jgi:4-amino-4-deoxy-L-arabinose transferase-like glycosyltransferase
VTVVANKIRAYSDSHPWALDVLLLSIVTMIAGVLRLVRLGDIPYGLNPDEAQLGTDAHKIMDGHLIGVYTHAALGQPSGHSYFTLPSIWLLGDTAFALRLPLALVGLAAIPLLYLLVRVTIARAEAFFASALLAVSYWHLLYSRVAHWSISYGTVLLAALLCLTLGMKSHRRSWFVASGAILGLGVYTYNIYPIAVVAFALAVSLISFVHYRGEEWRWWRGSIIALFAVAFIVALPMIVYVARPYSYYWSHFNNYANVSVTKSPAYKDADTAGKLRLIADQAGTFFSAYTWRGTRDYIDASGIRPALDWPTLVLLAAGVAMALRRWRDPMIIAAFCCVLVIPLPAVLQQGSITREPLGAAPYVMFFAALPLAAAWRAAWRSREPWQLAALGAVVSVVGMIGAITIRDYFSTWKRSELVQFAYHAEITSASEYISKLPQGTYVYFYSDRHPFKLEVRRFLAPNAQGSDRSFEFSDADASVAIDRPGPVTFVLLGAYRSLLPELLNRYPSGHQILGTHNGVTEFEAYEVSVR